MLQKDLVQEILSPKEKDMLTSFVDNKVMFEAVRKVLLAAVYYNGTLRKDATADPTRNSALALALSQSYTDEQLGQDLRGLAEGVRLVENGFSQLEVFETEVREKPEVTKNKAR